MFKGFSLTLLFHLPQGGKCARVVTSILALKSYNDWKQTGSSGVWKFGGNIKVTTSAKSFVLRNSEPFTSSLSRNLSMTEKSFHALSSDLDSNKMVGKLNLFVSATCLVCQFITISFF